jgi:hypothetical protein
MRRRATPLSERIYAVRTIQELLGHSEIKTTLIYVHAPSREVVSVKILKIFSFRGQALRLWSTRETVARPGKFCESIQRAWPDPHLLEKPCSAVYLKFLRKPVSVDMLNEP